MKTKILATIVTLMLLLGSVSFAITMPVNAPDAYYYLTVATSPSGIGATTAPLPGGPYKYPYDTWVNCTAPDEVAGPPGIKYKFVVWNIDGSNQTLGDHTCWAVMTQNRTVTAIYGYKYKLTVADTPFASLGVKVWIWDSGVYYNVFERWFDAGATAYAAVTGLSSSPCGLYTDSPYNNKWAYLVNFTGDATGHNDWTTYHYSDAITMNGPKNVGTQWAFMYRLYVYSNPNPPVPDPAGAGWYYQNTVAVLTASTLVINWAYEYRLDHWEVDGASQGSTNPINVLMNTNHTAIAFYKPWLFIYLDDDIGNLSGIKDTGKWYLMGVPIEFTAPNPVNIDSTHRYGFKYWLKVGSGWTNTSNPVWITFDVTWPGYTLRAIYHMQYLLTIITDPVGVTTIPGSGWKDAGTIITPGPTAPDTVDIVAGESRWKFDQWVRTVPPGYSTTANTIPSITMDQPKVFVAYYHKEFKREWYYSPTSISLGAGWPGSDWQTNGTLVYWGAPATDVSGNFVFFYWDIDGVVYPQGQKDVWVLQDSYKVGTAYYANKTKIFMDPSYHEEPGKAYCHEFDVTVYATNFDIMRNVSGQPMDIYAFDIGIKWDASLIELKSVTLNLGAFFAPNAYYVGMDQISSGYYRLIATVKGQYPGFSGTKAIFTMRFHVIYDACYPNDKWTWIEFDPVHRLLSNHLGNPIGPELGWKDCYYAQKTVKPVLELRDAADHDNTIVVHKNVPQTFFDVEVYLNNGVKVEDFSVTVNYDKTQIEAYSIVLGSYLKPPFIYHLEQINHGAGWVKVALTQDPSVPLQNCSGVLFTIRFKVIKADYYTLGPHGLTSPITISYGKLSVKCPGPFVQDTTGGNLGTKGATYVYNPLPGDLDFDGEVTVLDLQLVMSKYGTVPNPNPGGPYDVTYNGITDLYDLVFVALHFGDHV